MAAAGQALQVALAVANASIQINLDDLQFRTRGLSGRRHDLDRQLRP
jgi:hypothetical protein